MPLSINIPPPTAIPAPIKIPGTVAIPAAVNIPAVPVLKNILAAVPPTSYARALRKSPPLYIL